MDSPGLAAALALAPGLFWLWFFARKNSYRPEPRRLVATTFILGMLSTVPAAGIEAFFIKDSLEQPGVTLGTVAVNMFFFVGPVEELSKFLAVRLNAYRSRYFEEPMDGLVYAAAASLGFASLENFFYILNYGPEVIVARAPLSTLAHLVFGSFWGYALGLAWRRQGASRWVVPGLAIAATMHAFFDVAAFGGNVGIAVGLVALGAFWTVSRFNWARRVSPFRYRRNYPLLTCPHCQQRVRVTFTTCPRCGSQMHRGRSPLICGNCLAINRADAAFCTQCGDRFEG